jgi:hypothetical protein
MQSFTLSSAARSRLKLQISESGCRDPVIVLHDVADVAIDAAEKVRLSSQTSDLSDAARIGIVERYFESNPPQWRLAASIYEKRDCSAAELCAISDIEFAIRPAVQELLREMELGYSNGQYMFDDHSTTWTSLGCLIEAKSR